MIQSGIYIIRSLIHPQKFYVGSSINLQGREIRHFWELNKGIHANPKLQHYFDKYGEESLVFEIICLAPENEILKIEDSLIKELNPFFNIIKTAESRAGQRHSQQTRNRISAASKRIHRLSFGSCLVKQKL